MKSMVLIHGKPTRERYENPELPKPHEANWMARIAAELEARGIRTAVPAMPKPFFPIYVDWRAATQHIEVDEYTGYTGHSAGAEFLVRLFSTEKIEAERLVLVAPYRDEAGKYGDFSRYNLDKDIGKRIGKITILNSTDDSPAIQTNAHRLAEAIPEAELIELDGFGHFMIGNNMTGPAFPELLDILEV